MENNVLLSIFSGTIFYMRRCEKILCTVINGGQKNFAALLSRKTYVGATSSNELNSVPAIPIFSHLLRGTSRNIRRKYA
jgi:hypothetical protein